MFKRPRSLIVALLMMLFCLAALPALADDSKNEESAAPAKAEASPKPPCCIPETREIDVLPGEQTPPIIFRLPSKPALLSVISGEPCDIWLEGIRRSSCEASVRDPVAVPLPEDALRGEVTFVLVRPGKADVTRTEKFEAGQAKIVRVEGETP